MRKAPKQRGKEKMTNTDKMINMITEAYIKVMGVDKWNSLTDDEKHDVVMIIAKDLMKA